MCPLTIHLQCPNALTSECLEDADRNATSTSKADAASLKKCSRDWTIRGSHCTLIYMREKLHHQNHEHEQNPNARKRREHV